MPRLFDQVDRQRIGGQKTRRFQDFLTPEPDEIAELDEDWGELVLSLALSVAEEQVLETKRLGLSENEACEQMDMLHATYKRVRRQLARKIHRARLEGRRREFRERPVGRPTHRSCNPVVSESAGGHRIYALEPLSEDTYASIMREEYAKTMPVLEVADKKHFVQDMFFKALLVYEEDAGSMEKRNIALELKELAENGTFQGNLSVYGNVDLGNDMVAPGAFAKSLKENGNKVPLLAYHDDARPIGVLNLKDTNTALVANGVLNLDLVDAQHIRSMMLFNLKNGLRTGLSIGFQTVRDSIENGVRVLKELKLFEGSVVTLPMNELAFVSSAKSHRDPVAGLRFLRKYAPHLLADAWTRKFLGYPDSISDPVETFKSDFEGVHFL